ncbi:MAG TPA: hypothetical protein VH325_07890, partial [Bryobacteraceae bacterium]|nr:hypothetical protein [Bryobacteraceae bacterium]
MARRRSVLIFGVLLPLLLAALVIIGSLYVLRSKWLENDLRHRAIAAIERATGARVDLGSFRYDWRTLTLELDNLVLHGTEPADAPPLFHTSVIRVQLKIVSLFKRDIDVTSLLVRQPHLYLLFRPDGTTNIPPVKVRQNKTAPETLIDLKIAHFTIDQGTLQTDFRQIPLSARGDNLNAILTFDAARERYDVRLSSRQLHVESTETLPAAADLDLQADLDRNRLTVRQFSLQTGKSRVTGNIIVTNFRNPVADAQLSVYADAAEVGKISELPELSEGSLQITGAAHYDASSPFTFHGKMFGRNIAYRSRIFSLTHISAESDIYADTQLIDLKHLTASVLGSRVNGSASLKQFRRLTVAGQFHALDVNEVAPYLTKQTLPWRGLADGPFSIDGNLGRRISGFVLKADAEIRPAEGGIPLSGNVDVTYRQATHQIELGSSQLILPRTQLTLSGVPEQSLTVSLDSTDLNELKPALPFFGFANTALPLSLNNGGQAHFAGIIADPLTNPQIRGEVALTRFEAQGEAWDQLRAHATLSAASVQFSGLTLDQGSLHASGSGRIPLAGSNVNPHAP